MEKYQELVEQKRSVLSIPIELSISELERTLNKQLDGVVYEDNDFKDGDKMKIRAEKKEPIRVSIDSQVISYQVPVDLKIQYDAGLTILEANGEITMDFKTAFRIRDDWGIETETAVEGHEWIRTPRVRMAGISIPVGFIANLVLNNSRQYIARSIDGMVREQGGLESLVSDTWQQLYEPMLVSPEYNTWLLVNPQRIGMSPITTIKDSLYTQLLIEGKPTLSVGPRPQALQATTLPPFKEEPQTFEGFLINIGATISYDEAERLARESLVGETFTSGKRAESSKISPSGDRKTWSSSVPNYLVLTMAKYTFRGAPSTTSTTMPSNCATWTIPSIPAVSSSRAPVGSSKAPSKTVSRTT